MSSINKTPHYNLSQFGDSPDDKPSWRGDYTADMSKIDSQMYRNETDATTATSTANTAKNTADNALELAQTNQGDIAEQESYFTALGVTSEPTAQALMSTINGKAENTALTALQGTVSTLSDKVDGKADSSNVYTKSQADTTFTEQGGYSGTAQALNSAITTNEETIQSVSDSLESLKTDGVKPIDFIPATKVLTDVFSEAWLTGVYSPISHLATIMLRIGDRQGRHSNVLKTIAGNTKRPLLSSPFDVKYRPTVFILSSYAPMGNSGNWANMAINPNESGTNFLYYWPGASAINSGQTILASMMLTYFVSEVD